MFLFDVCRVLLGWFEWEVALKKINEKRKESGERRNMSSHVKKNEQRGEPKIRVACNVISHAIHSTRVILELNRQKTQEH